MPRWMSVLLLVLVSSSVHLLIHYYLWRRLVRDTGLPQPWRRRVTIGIIVLGFSMPITMWTSRLVSASIGQWLGWPAFLWMALSALTFLGLLAADLARVAGRGMRRVTGASRRSSDPPRDGSAEVELNRRQFIARISGATVASAAAGATGLGLYEVLRAHDVNDVPVELARLPEQLDGFTIVQLTDVHVGYTVTRTFVQAMVDRANAARPDLIAITGDLVDGDVDTLADAVAPLAELRAPHGVYFVTGNHEYYVGVEPWLAELRRLGIRVLRNEHVAIGNGRHGFDLAGIDDHDAARFGKGHGADLARAVAGRDTSRELVLLAHQPRQVHEARRHGVGLQLSGHTHGGQIWPWHYLVMAQQGGLLAGLSRHGDTQLYISRGAGYWGPPVRVCAPAEISRIVLRAGPRA